MDQETLHFKLELAGTYWLKRPECSVWVNDQQTTKTTVETESGQSFFIEFDHTVNEGPVQLKIRLENKTNSDTVENDDKTAIVKDMLLHIRSVEIDEINLDSLLWTKSKFIGDDPARPVLDNCVDLGWNGSWILDFQSPFYIWLLENI